MAIPFVGMTNQRFTPGRAHGPVSVVVLHATAGRAPGDLAWLRKGGDPAMKMPRTRRYRVGAMIKPSRRFDMSTVPEGRYYGNRFRPGWIEDGIGYIPLARGGVTLVDPEMVSILNGNWSVNKLGYPTRNFDGRPVTMHCLITGCVSNKFLVVDHINGDKLDNRRANLRIVTRGENAVNVRRHAANNKSGYRGVYWYTQRQCWRASFTWQKYTRHSCGHDTPEAAARAYDALVRKHGPPLAFLNFPEEVAS